MRGGTLDERRERAYSLDEEYDDDDDIDRKVCSYIIYHFLCGYSYPNLIQLVVHVPGFIYNLTLSPL